MSRLIDVYRYDYKTGQSYGEKLCTVQMVEYRDRVGTHNGHAVHDSITTYVNGNYPRVRGTADSFWNVAPPNERFEAIYCVSPHGGTPVVVCNRVHGIRARIREQKRKGTYVETPY